MLCSAPNKSEEFFWKSSFLKSQATPKKLQTTSLGVATYIWEPPRLKLAHVASGSLYDPLCRSVRPSGYVMQRFPNREAQTSLGGGANINHSHLKIVKYAKVSPVMKVLC